jgi:hypothetical protein
MAAHPKLRFFVKHGSLVVNPATLQLNHSAAFCRFERLAEENTLLQHILSASYEILCLFPVIVVLGRCKLFESGDTLALTPLAISKLQLLYSTAGDASAAPDPPMFRIVPHVEAANMALDGDEVGQTHPDAR